MKISIIIPCYNEEKTLNEIVNKVLCFKSFDKELIIVDDCSSDNTQVIINDLVRKYNEIKSIRHDKNFGKGEGIKSGIKISTGDIILIQDADLEYNPEDYDDLLKPFLNTDADVVVIGLIGERGREVQEFIHQTLGETGLAKSVVVASPANISPVVRLKATNLTHLIAEYFRDQGKNVLLLCDSLSRVAHAQREIGLAIGEPPTAKGYPPSVFALLPRLIERAGVGRNGYGSITAVYTVLAEGDDRTDPIIDIARASLDGQVMLSRDLADAAHYPAIDLAGSISRVMNSLVNTDMLQAANRFRRLWTLYQQNQDLIQVDAYSPGSNPDLDQAIQLRPQIKYVN